MNQMARDAERIYNNEGNVDIRKITKNLEKSILEEASDLTWKSGALLCRTQVTPGVAYPSINRLCIYTR